MYISLRIERVNGVYYYSAMRSDGELTVGKANSREEVFEALEEAVTIDI